MEECIADGVGGADCLEIDGVKKYRAPSELKNYLMFTQDGFAGYTAWCYNTDLNTAKGMMEWKIREFQKQPR